MSNSNLISYTNLTKHHSGKRKYRIDRITPHCIVGQWTARQAADYFARTPRKSSCNYAIGKDGDIALCVDEANQSWCSSSSSNDNQAVTIEIASETKHPYVMTEKAYKALEALCVDICKRNGKNKLIWIPDKSTALKYKPKNGEMLLTVHRWFADKACPGDWLMARLPKLAVDVTEALVNYQLKTAERFGFEAQTMAYLRSYKYSDALFEKLAKGEKPDYARGVQGRFGLDDNTIAYLQKYKYADDLLRKLATAK